MRPIALLLLGVLLASAQAGNCPTTRTLLQTPSIVTDGPGPYVNRENCTWVIDGDDGVQYISFQILQSDLESLWDYLYISDGNGNRIASLTSNQSGRQVLVAGSESSIYFFSDDSAVFDGYNVSFTFDACPFACSNHGSCNTGGVCNCNAGWTGVGCDISLCPSNCGVHGSCAANQSGCVCNGTYTGAACDVPSSTSQQWTAFPLPSSVYDQYLPIVETTSALSQSYRTGHTLIANGDSSALYLFGGFDATNNLVNTVLTYTFSIETWNTVTLGSSVTPPGMSDHTAVYDPAANTMLIFGGRLADQTVVSTLWAFDMTASLWSLISPSAFSDTPLPVFGHTATLMNTNIMVVLGGLIDGENFNPYIQLFNISSLSWSVVLPSRSSSSDAPLLNQHAAVAFNDIIYISGGLVGGGSLGLTSPLSRNLYAYNVATNSFASLSSLPTFLTRHTAVLLGQFMIVYGGAYATSQYQISNLAFAYDFICNSWTTLSVLGLSNQFLGRFGHRAVAVPATVVPVSTSVTGARASGSQIMIVHGGYDGAFVSGQLATYWPPLCSSFLDATNCSSSQLVSCFWDQTVCRSAMDLPLLDPAGQIAYRNATCPATSLCHFHLDCASCSSTSGCGWCLASRSCIEVGRPCTTTLISAGSSLNCDNSSSLIAPISCASRNTCYYCAVTGFGPACQWNGFSCAAPTMPASSTTVYPSPSSMSLASPLPTSAPVVSISVPLPTSTAISEADSNTTANTNSSDTSATAITCALCSSATNCTACLSSTCMWCESLNLCFPQGNYPNEFQYGQCFSGYQDLSCSLACADILSCQSCLAQPTCGWCGTDDSTGVGACMDGTLAGPTVSGSCDAISGSWEFDACPLCQCNGHSTCLNQTYCQNCTGSTGGANCATCVGFTYGNALNGGMCQACESDYSPQQCLACNNLSGACTLCTNNTAAPFCNSCLPNFFNVSIHANATDTNSSVIGYQCVPCSCNPAGGSCNQTSGACICSAAYAGSNCSSCSSSAVAVFSQCAIPLSDNQETVATEPLLFYFATDPDGVNLGFQFRSTPPDVTPEVYLLTLTAYDSSGNFFATILNNTMMKKGLAQIFTISSNLYQSDGFLLLKVAVNFDGGVLYGVTFAQSAAPLNLVNFFVTFFACFFSLLFLAYFGWRIRLRYELARDIQERRQNMIVMASRPFSGIVVWDLTRVKRKRLPTVTRCVSMANQDTADGQSSVHTFLFDLPCFQDGHRVFMFGSTLLSTTRFTRKLLPAAVIETTAPPTNPPSAAPEEANNGATEMQNM